MRQRRKKTKDSSKQIEEIFKKVKTTKKEGGQKDEPKKMAEISKQIVKNLKQKEEEEGGK